MSEEEECAEERTGMFELRIEVKPDGSLVLLDHAYDDEGGDVDALNAFDELVAYPKNDTPTKDTPGIYRFEGRWMCDGCEPYLWGVWWAA